MVKKKADEKISDKFSWNEPGEMTLTQCVYCVNLKKVPGVGKCSAFPDGIPNSIWENRIFHIQPIAGDRGIVFEPYPDKRAAFESGKLFGIPPARPIPAH